MSGAMIRRISWLSSVFSQTGRRPNVVPLFGSVPINGTGMKGAVEGLNHCDSPGGGNCGAAPPASGGAGWSSATESAAPSAKAAHTAPAQQTRRRPHAINLSHRRRTTHLGNRFGEALYQPIDVGGCQISHGGNAKYRVGQCPLSGINHESLRLERIVHLRVVEAIGQPIRTQHHRGIARRQYGFDAEPGEPDAYAFGKCGISIVTRLTAALLGILTQRLDQRVINMHSR